FQSATGGDATGDIISGFERIWGSDFGDDLTGDATANLIYGRDGADTIDGGDGNDTIGGGGGGDADQLAGGDGTDVLSYTASFAGITIDLNDAGGGFQSASGGDATGDIISGFERVWGSDFGDSLTGDGEDNLLSGRAGDDTLNGGIGNDTLIGGSGADTFQFDQLGAAHTDQVNSFNSSQGDTLALDSAVFTALAGGALLATEFRVNTTGLAEASADRIIYNSDTGQLFYDADGTGATAGAEFAQLTGNPVLDALDFFSY
ncbi:calcium-binding protein, partial [Cribrihabitans sp. XS_ASV171]